MINPTNRFNLKNNFSAISKTHKESSKLEFIKSMRGATISFLKMSHNFWRCSKKKVISYIRMPLNLITLMNNVRPFSRSYLIQTKCPQHFWSSFDSKNGALNKILLTFHIELNLVVSLFPCNPLGWRNNL